MGLVAQGNKQSPIKVVSRQDICYLKDTNLNEIISITFSKKDLALANAISTEFNKIINKYLNCGRKEFVESDDCYND